MSDLFVSVLFSSYNGASRRLRHMLESLVCQDLPHDRWELVAVDNNSNDDTFDLLTSYSDKLPITILQQRKPGKSGALNLALDRVNGDIVVITDDDIRAEPNWLKAIVDCAVAYPGYGVFGGRIVPDWEKEPKGLFINWIPMGSTFAIANETQSGPCDPTKVWGPNTIIRRELLGTSVRYREDIGPLPGGMFAMGEDQEIIMRLSGRGVKPYHCAEAIVHHWIPASSVNELWIQKRGERLGYGIPALFPDEVPGGVRLRGVPLRTWVESVQWSLRAAMLYLLPQSKTRFWAIWKYYYMRGYRAGIRRYAPATLAR
ncbi:glycosyltransferase family 2 protein [Rhizobium leguminosarum]|uniref:glycosyltransferase n=1 Tax=Rhizobium leguminosarum TaxID=384 RepID=UPI001031EEE9|nr:glycosyltransferase family 2 protein [Rhizobium leguminosarum]TAU99129.1 glycosyltransferase family 2 protein [Rhizobium leguminosarum]TAV13929.1 glycosyltransferase family 2 protein [Rhizobium leguminosarum]TAW54779.1 glycosyltransferase family 2 protein [Rhizobium leguminosarum]TAX53704.1 glycosyltransferase family 2 protein [Rhizobium leguminosarum]TAY40219.1 glycosyltransferase family 2 protein [Rhizobium leguminosarum]